ncbi:MAG: hypothetical protein BVN28_00655 [Nitrospira sp. ST-bin4]|nr:MAG: hypothetical protein BVN28_00655 [Nitrospira sp. ST-bin4]
MDYLSETTRRERRSLLAAGFTGCILFLLKKFPAKFEVAGMKFETPELPYIAVGALIVAILYLLVKFSASCVYERFSATKTAHELLIRERKTNLDILREEEALAQEEQGLEERKRVTRLQLEADENRINGLQIEMIEAETSYVKQLGEADKKMKQFQEILATQPGRQVRSLGGTLKDRREIETRIRELKEGQESLLKTIKEEHEKKAFNVEDARNRLDELRKAYTKELQITEGGLNQRRMQIRQWHQADKVVGTISPFHLFLEIYLPLLVGVVAIGTLTYLMFHFPPAPMPPSMPEI